VKGLLFIILAMGFFAVDSFLRAALVQSGISAYKIVFYEYLFLGLFVFYQLFKSFRKFWQGQVSHLFYFFLVGGLGAAISSLCLSQAYSLLPNSLVWLLQKIQILFLLVAAHYFLQEKMSKIFLLFLAIAIVGMLLVLSAPLSQVEFTNWQTLFGSAPLKGYVFLFISMFCWAISIVFSKKLSLAGFSEKELMAGRYFFALLILAPMFYSKVGDPILSSAEFTKILALSLVSGLLGMYFYYAGLKSLSVRVVSLSELFLPLWLVVISSIFLGDKITELQIIGSTLIILSATIVQWKKY